MRYYGAIGYGVTSEISAGVWEDTIVEHKYYGNVMSDSRRLMPGENLNSDLKISNRISVVADDILLENYHAIRYIEWMGVKWTATVEVAHPRLILSLGEVYNGPSAGPGPTPP